MEHLHLEKTLSTQDILKEMLQKKAGEFLISTDFQEKGRGRQGSAWTHFKEAIAFSFNIHPNEVVTLTPLEIGLLLTKFFNQKVMVKWPNDLLSPMGEKVGGILCQLYGNQVLVGIGINIKTSEDWESEAKNFPYPIGAVFSGSSSINEDYKSQMPLRIYEFIRKNRLSSKEVQREFPKACVHYNLEVEIHNNDHVESGLFIGIGENGEAILESQGTQKKILTGSLRIN